MDIKKAKRAYRGQIGMAKQRGIEFLFDFPAWSKWWFKQLGPNWQVLRGCRKGQYVMARERDKGPYASWNVECILGKQNAADAAKNGRYPTGENNGLAKLTESQVIKIYKMGGIRTHIARQFGVHRTTIKHIKEGSQWGWLTCKLGPATPCKERLNREQVLIIYASNLPIRRLAREYGVFEGTIRRIKNRNNKHLR